MGNSASERIKRLFGVSSEWNGKPEHAGEDLAERLEFVPASFRVIHHASPKLVCVFRDRLVQAPAASWPIEHGLLGSWPLAHVLVPKCADNVPLYRQSVIYTREGMELERSRLAGWVGAANALLPPLSERCVVTPSPAPSARRRHANACTGAGKW